MNRLRVKEVMAKRKKILLDGGITPFVSQYQVAAVCIPFNMTDASKAQLLAKWNNGKALQKLTCEVLFKLRAALGCTYGDLIGRSYAKLPATCDEEKRLIKKWIAYEEEFGNALDAFVKISDEYKVAIDFILLTDEENLLP